MRAEAAKKKKEEAARKKAEQSALGGGPKKSQTRLDAKLEQNKKLGFGKVGGQNKADVSEHFATDDFDKALDKIKELSEECGMRKLNA